VTAKASASARLNLTMRMSDTPLAPL
jgi:hypothetical protein